MTLTYFTVSLAFEWEKIYKKKCCLKGKSCGKIYDSEKRVVSEKKKNKKKIKEINNNNKIKQNKKKSDVRG